MKQFSIIVFLSILTSFSFHINGQVIANNDSIKTGPSQKIKYDITANDIIPCNNHLLNIVSVSPSSAGTATVDGDFLIFTPNSGVISQTVDVVYNLECPGGNSDQATVSITITPFNLPLNVIQTGAECIDKMPEDVDFGVQLKYIAYSDENSGASSTLKGGYLQQFHIPLVGDLNGDGKPEIISPGLTVSGTLTTNINNIYIFDGQTGEKIFKFALNSLGSGYGNFQLGILPYHQSPSYLAIADVDKDGVGEIIVCQSSGDGKVYALKPTLDTNKKITGLTKIWDADYGHKAPLSGTFQIYGQPIPNIVDINGDGIPELVVYNKIYNAQTGKLLMAWNGTASLPQASDVTTTSGLNNYNPGSASTNQTFSNNIKSYAMVGRRPSSSSLYNDLHIAIPAIVDINGDGLMEIVTGNRIHKFNLTYLGRIGETGNHTMNTYSTVEGPTSVTLPTNTAGTTTQTYYFNDGFTRVADLDGDGKLEAVVFQNASGTPLDLYILVYIWDLETGNLIAASSFYSNGDHGTFGIPFVGDINNKLDGRDVVGGAFTKKIPEICVTAGRISRDRTATRSGLGFHPLSNMTNQRFESIYNHIIAITYDGGEANIEDRLKISWTLEHEDTSNNTGITMFDFNNDGAFDLCYRDEETLRVISPKLGTTDYIRYTETEATSDAILFRTQVYSETGFEAPAIADVNMDGSADIIVAGWVNQGIYWANVYVFEYTAGSQMWAPCPPVWNQALYNPLYINEDLTVPAKPISMLTPFTTIKGGYAETITPYNGAWIQQPIVKEGEYYIPVYRHPDAVLTNMKVESDGGNTKIKIIVRNDGLASINSTTPIYFYHTVPATSTKLNAVVIPIGVDVFPNEKVELEYTISGSPVGLFTHCSLVNTGTGIPANGYTDCRPTNNEGYTSIIRAVDDYVIAFSDSTSFNVVANDTIVAGGNAILEIYEGPKKGIATVSGDKISYVPTGTIPYRDTLTYLLKCEYGGDTLASVDTAYVFIVVADYPDNIVDEELCYAPSPSIVFNVKQQWSATNRAHSNTGPLVGDLDGDGIPEIVTFDETMTILNVTNGADGALKTSLIIPYVPGTGGWFPVMTAALVDADANGRGEIILATSDLKLTSYEATVSGGVFSLTQKWQTTFVNISSAIDNTPQPIVTDLNGDGIPEVIVYNQIFNALTGSKLGETEAVASAYVGRNPHRVGNINSNFMTAADLDGDGMLEIVAGGKVYKPTFNASKTAVTCTILYQNTSIPDGYTAVADADMNGSLDVVVVSALSNGTTWLYVWSPTENRLIHGLQIYSNPTYNAQSYPFIGDIDGFVHPVTGKKYPEICVTIVGAVKAYKYDPIAGKYSEKWSLITTDASGGTGITLFDFNNDGINELVYRDQTLIRILNGITDNAEPVLADVTGSISCYSGTAFEYPVIADTDGDGSANICVTCSQGYEIAPHYLRTFESATEPWAPARNVWNQVNYEPLQINSNLTTPIYPIPKNIEFSGKYPYNGALIQVSTMVNTDFSVVQLAPDPSIQAMWTEITDDTIRVWVRIENLGVRNTNISLPVALYGVKTPPAIAGGASLIATKPVGVSLVPGDSCEVYFDVPIASMPPAFSVRIQDDGVNFPADGSYLDCNYGNNVSGLSFLMAIDDHVSLYEATLIDVLANDFFGDCERGGFLDIGLVASAGPTHGSVMINADSTLRYTPVANYIGVDSLDYYIKCGTDYDTATVFINIIEKPDNISDADCFVIPDPTEWTIKQSQTISAVSTYMPALTGDLDGDGLPEVVIGTDMNVSPYAPFNASHVGRKVKILHGGDFDSPTVFSTNMPYNPIMPGVIAIARVDVSGVETGIVVVAEGDLRLRAYDISGALLWTSSDYFTDSGNPAYTSVSVGFADFNNDGKAEVYCGNRIFDAATGVFKCKGTGNEGYTKHWGDKPLYSTIAADVTGDGRLELIAGNQIYKVAGDLSSMTIISTVTPPQCIENAGLIIDGEGATSVIDIDNDGDLEVLVRKIVNGYAFIYIWSPKKQAVLAQKLITVSTGHLNTPFIGDLDGNGKPEIVILAASPNNIYAYKYVSGQNLLSEFWSLSHSDNSGMTGVTLFDFNQDGISELVYRDETHLRIINGSKKSHITGNDTTAVYNLTSFTSRSGTGYEYPVVVDIDNDGASEILVAGGAPGAANGNLVIYKSAAAPWAPARKVWNQYLYNAVNVNEDLTIPKYQINPAIVFPGSDGILGTSHDVRPYNNFLQQQTVLSKNGTPLWLTPDVYPDPTLISSTVIGDSVSITIGIINKGDASIGSPVYVSLYKESISTANYMITDSTNIQVHPGDTGYVIVRIPDMSLYPAANIVVRVNDNGMTFTYQPECDDTNNTLTIQNPALSLYMEKDATLLLTPPVQHNGTLPNPVSVLFSENIKYEITAVNITGTTAPIQICDTLPAYLKYNTGSENPSTNFVKSVTASGVPVREILTWNVPGVAAGASTTVSFTATPVDGSCASQPLYINKAWITVGGLQIPTGNSTYHQGAGVGIATFSAGLGGQLYNAEPQAVDYRTAARSGVLVVPDDGYQFDGWSHEAYTSLRGDKIEARDGVMNYDTLTIFGNVELQAHFSLEAYPVHYYLNGADNAESNPETYTVKSGTLMLEAPEKIGDVFTGWTGSNGDKPQAVVTIPEGSTGELEFYANFLYSGRENDVPETELQEDKIWAAKSDVYVRTSKVGSMVRIYSIDGMLIRQQEIKTAGETKIQLPRGIYIVTLNNDIGKKIRID